MNSYIVWQYIFHNCLSNVWRAFESHRESQVLVLPNDVMMVQGSWLLLSSSNVYYCILMSSLAKILYPEHLHALSMIIGNGYCLRLMTLFSWRELLIHHTLLSSFLKVLKWIWGTGWGIECTGLAFGSMSMHTLYVDKRQEFHQKSFFFPIALNVSLLFDVHLDEWVLSWPQLHLSFHTWRPESLLQSIWVNLHQRACLWLGC